MILARGATPVVGLQLRHCWYAQNITGDQYETLAGLLGCRPRQLYGMTETIPAVLTSRALGPVPSLMGEPTIGCRVDIAYRDDGTPVPGGEVGDVGVGGETGSTLFAGSPYDPQTPERAHPHGSIERAPRRAKG